MTNTPLNTDDELREAINQRFDVVTTQGHHQSCGEYQTAVDDIMRLILTDRKKHELQARIDELTKLDTRRHYGKDYQESLDELDDYKEDRIEALQKGAREL